MKEEITESEAPTVSLGKKLANLRLEQGLTQRNIASKIHVKTSIIEDIELDKTVNAPAVFLRGYIKHYATIVGLPVTEYQEYLEQLSNQQSSNTMKNYSNKEQNKRNGKRLLFISIFILVIIVGVTAFFTWQDNKSELIEVTHYISKTPSTNS